MASRPDSAPQDPADTEPAEHDPGPDEAGAPLDPIVESIEETGEPSPGNFA